MTTIFVNSPDKQINKIQFPDRVPVKLSFETEAVGYIDNLIIEGSEIKGNIYSKEDFSGLLPTIGIKVISYKGNIITDCILEEVVLCVIQPNIIE